MALKNCGTSIVTKPARKTGTYTIRKTFDVGRDVKTGRFVPVKAAKNRPASTKVERIPKAGFTSASSSYIISKTAKKYDKSMRRLAKR